MKKIITFMLLAAFTTATQGQQPNVRLTQLEQYLQTQHINVTKKQNNSAEKITCIISASHNAISGWKSYFKKEMSEEETDYSYFASSVFIY